MLSLLMPYRQSQTLPDTVTLDVGYLAIWTGKPTRSQDCGLARALRFRFPDAERVVVSYTDATVILPNGDSRIYRHNGQEFIHAFDDIDGNNRPARPCSVTFTHCEG